MKNSAQNAYTSLLDSIVRVPLADINGECLALLTQLARKPGPPVSDFIGQLRPALIGQQLSPRQLAARARLLLVDLEFANAPWWLAVVASPNHAHRAGLWLTPLPKARAIKLTRATLMLAWHLSRAHSTGAAILMGLSDPVIKVISHLDLQQVDAISEKQFERLRPRWEDRPSIWRELLADAEDEEEAAREFSLRALQLAWAPSGSQSRSAKAALLSDR